MDRLVLEAIWTEHLRNNPHDYSDINTTSDANLLALVRGKYPDLFDGSYQTSPFSLKGEERFTDERDRPPRPSSPPQSLLFGEGRISEEKRRSSARRTIRDLDPPVVYRLPQAKKISSSPVKVPKPQVASPPPPPSGDPKPQVAFPPPPPGDPKETLPSWLQEPEVRSLLELIRDGHHEASHRELNQLPFNQQQWLRHYRGGGATPLQRYLRDKDPASQVLAKELLST